MAETPLKRQREEAQIEDFEESKRHKSYNHILSILEEEEEDPTQDLSSLMTTLQQELSSSPTTITDQENSTTASSAAATTTVDDYPSSSSSSYSFSSGFLKEEEEEEDDKERVIRHLLEASDDELGIPNREVVNGDGFEEFVSSGNEFNDIDGLSLCDGLWEFEDANANYYAFLQSELFM